MPIKKAKTKAPGRRPGAKKSAVKPAAKKAPTRAASKPAAKLTPPRLGEIWPGQGGRYVGDILGLDGQPSRHMIAPVDPRAIINGIYGPNEKLAGALSTRDGLANTRAMAKAGSKMADDVLNLKIDGHQDYYIAANDQAKIAYVNGKQLYPGVKYMWTSTQLPWFDAYAWLQYFENGYQYSDRKSDEYRAFVVRSINIQ